MFEITWEMVDRRPLLSGKGTGERAGRGRGECGLLGAPPTGKPTVLGGTAKLLGRASLPGAAAAISQVTKQTPPLEIYRDKDS